MLRGIRHGASCWLLLPPPHDTAASAPPAAAACRAAVMPSSPPCTLALQWRPEEARDDRWGWPHGLGRQLSLAGLCKIEFRRSAAAPPCAAEMTVGPIRVLLADEISTGLDSNTTFQITKSLRDYSEDGGGSSRPAARKGGLGDLGWPPRRHQTTPHPLAPPPPLAAHVMQATTLVGLLQPAPETYDLFDEVRPSCGVGTGGQQAPTVTASGSCGLSRLLPCTHAAPYRHLLPCAARPAARSSCSATARCGAGAQLLVPSGAL